MDIFEACREINELIESENEFEARNCLIKLLDYHERTGQPYSELVNHLTRELGLFPYLQTATAGWQDRFVYESFKVDVGLDIPITLHREQSYLLKKLLVGESVAVSAPTSFGKSFVIDSFISIGKPKNVVIIVPTIALTDETRRRLYPKFASRYNIITTTDAELSENNIFVFPQERAIGYLSKLDSIDILIVDEFYKASSEFDKERSPALIRAILKLGPIAKQRYFLAPNISSLNDSPFTRGMEFLQLDFNTVFLQKHELYREIGNDAEKKAQTLISILEEAQGKTLIYAGAYSGIDAISELVLRQDAKPVHEILNMFSDWLSENYEKRWSLVELVKRGVGIHNGQLHRSLSQIQVKLFEEPEGLKQIISTSSIIEGVNTSAENIVIWRNRNGRFKLNDFTYRNIIGRGGRMFKHFIGKIYILEEPPEASETAVTLEFPEALLGGTDEVFHAQDLTPAQIAKIIAYREEMEALVGGDFARLQYENTFQTSDSNLLRNIAINMREKPSSWNGLGYLNSANVEEWDRMLFQIIRLQPSAWEIDWTRFVEFVKVLSGNWLHSIPELLTQLSKHEIAIRDFFKLERTATFKLSALINDVCSLHNVIFEKNVDVSSFTSKLAHAFLPPVVYQLEEYGLPRMISKKIHSRGLINFEDEALTLNAALESFRSIGSERLIQESGNIGPFEAYIIRYFYDGIRHG